AAPAVSGESTNGRVASAGGPYARRGGAGDVGAHRRAAATKTQTDVCRLWRQRRLGQTAPRPGRGRARGAVPRSRFRRNPKGAWVLLGSAIVRLAKIARPRMRAIQALLCFSHSHSRARDDPHRDRLRRAGRLSGLSLPVARPRIRALRSPHFHSPIWKFARSGTLSVNTHARDRLYFHHGLLALLFLPAACSVKQTVKTPVAPRKAAARHATLDELLARLDSYQRRLQSPSS